VCVCVSNCRELNHGAPSKWKGGKLPNRPKLLCNASMFGGTHSQLALGRHSATASQCAAEFGIGGGSTACFFVSTAGATVIPAAVHGPAAGSTSTTAGFLMRCCTGQRGCGGRAQRANGGYGIIQLWELFSTCSTGSTCSSFTPRTIYLPDGAQHMNQVCTVLVHHFY
jgi:hypothetical protein